MDRILISGYYGFNNSGDEAILQIIVDNLRQRLPDVEITVLSNDPEDTRRRHGIRAVSRMNPLTILRAVSRCDLLISGGGSLLQDVTSQRSICYYLGVIRLAKLFGKKVVIYSQGVGPIIHEKNRRRTAKCLEFVDSIVVRDPKSKRLLEEIGVDGARVNVTSDPVIRVNRPDTERGKKLLEQAGVRRQEGRMLLGWAPREGAGEAAFTDEEIAAIRRLKREKEVDIVLLPFHPKQDTSVCRRMKEELGDEVALLEHRCSSDEMLSVVGNLDLVVGVRLHSLIYAAVMGVPMVGISYDPKIDSFVQSVGVPHCMTVENFTADGLAEEYDRVMEHYPELQTTIARRVLEMKQGMCINEDAICRLLREG